MSDILSYLDNTKFSVMQLTRIIIDFGWYPHAKFLLEKYYSEIAHDKLIKHLVSLPINNIKSVVITGSYILYIIGVIKSLTGHSNIYTNDIQKEFRIVYSMGYNNYYITKISKYNTTINAAMSDHELLDIFSNTLEHNGAGKFKFTFNVPLINLLQKNMKENPYYCTTSSYFTPDALASMPIGFILSGYKILPQ
jgi:hypothetical protein